MPARLEDGWIRVAYDDAELNVVEMSLGSADVPGPWYPAFLHTVGEERVVQIRPPAAVLPGNAAVWVRINGTAFLVGLLGEVTLPVGRRRRRG